MGDKDREKWVKETRYYLGEDNILYTTVVGDADEEIAIEDKETVLKFANMVKGKLNCLIDLNRCGKQSSGARKIRKELNEDEKIGRIAFYGMHPVARVIASFVMGISKKKDMRFFKTKEEVLAWLKE